MKLVMLMREIRAVRAMKLIKAIRAIKCHQLVGSSKKPRQIMALENVLFLHLFYMENVLFVLSEDDVSPSLLHKGERLGDCLIPHFPDFKFMSD